MFLFKRDGYYHIEYIDSESGQKKRKSTRTKVKSEALQYLSEFKIHLKASKKLPEIRLIKFQKEYEEFVKASHSAPYLRSVHQSFSDLISDLGDLNLTQINNRMLEKFLLKKFSTSKYSAQAHLKNLKAALNKAIYWNYLKSNPFKGIRLPKIPKKNPHFLNRAELSQIVEVTLNKTLQRLFIFAYYTGLRLTEVITLRWENIDLKHGIITVANNEHNTTKSKRERVVPICNILSKDLNQHARPDGFVFVNSSGVKLNADYVTKNFKKAVRRSKLDDTIHFHDLRHGFASSLVQAGVSLYVVKELLGHQDIKTTMIYSHLQTENLSDAIKKLEP